MTRTCVLLYVATNIYSLVWPPSVAPAWPEPGWPVWVEGRALELDFFL